MKNKILVAVTLLAVLLSTVACAATNAPTGNTGTQEVTILTTDEFNQTPNMQKQVEMTNGSTLTVTLVSNPSTGFSWNETAQIADMTILQQLTHENIPAPTSAVVGAPGTENWTFKALKAGTTTVHFEYSRPWEGGEKGVWTLDLTVTVK